MYMCTGTECTHPPKGKNLDTIALPLSKRFDPQHANPTLLCLNCRYLDMAIGYWIRDKSDFIDADPTDMVMARSLKAQCLILDNRFEEAQFEADRILEVQRNNLIGLLVKAEAHYNRSEVRNLQDAFRFKFKI